MAAEPEMQALQTTIGTVVKPSLVAIFLAETAKLGASPFAKESCSIEPFVELRMNTAVPRLASMPAVAIAFLAEVIARRSKCVRLSSGSSIADCSSDSKDAVNT